MTVAQLFFVYQVFGHIFRWKIGAEILDGITQLVAVDEADDRKQQGARGDRVAGEEPKLFDEPDIEAETGGGAKACSDNQTASGFVHRAAPRNGRHFIVVQKALWVNSARGIPSIEVADVLHLLFAVADAEDVSAGRFDRELAHAPGL